MIDIHTHILPGLDDGARDMEDSLSMAALALKSGVHTLVATSHANTGGFFKEYSIEEYLQRLEAFRKALDEVKLEFEDGALEAIAEKALERKTGARALRAIIEEIMLDIMYEIPKDDNIGKVTITREYVEHKGGPKITLRGDLVIYG